MVIRILLLLIGTVLCNPSQSQSSYRLLRLYHNNDVDPFYYLKLQVGHPSQQQKVLFDTGSSSLVLKAADCDGCIREDHPFYRFESSESYAPIMCNDQDTKCNNQCPGRENNLELCNFKFSYANNATQIGGLIALDEIKFDNEGERDRFQSTIFLTTKVTGRTRLRQNGILGLSPKKNENMLYKWFKRHNIDQVQFRFCLAKRGGSFQLGIPQTEQIQRKPDAKVSILSDSYFLQTYDFTSIQVLTTNLSMLHDQNQRSWAVMDTGSVATYFPPQAYNQFEAIVAKICEDHPNCKKAYRQLSNGFKNLCFKIDGLGKFFKSDETLIDGILPSLDFKFNQNTITWKASEYLQIEKTAKGHYACLTILLGDEFLLGANWLRYKRVTVDLSNHFVEIEANYDCSFGNTFSISEVVYRIKSAPGILLYLVVMVVVLLVCLRHKFFVLVDKIKRKFGKRDGQQIGFSSQQEMRNFK